MPSEQSDLELRLRVAELCGWKQCSITLNGVGGWPPLCNSVPDCRVNNSDDWCRLPDYPNDLNAMHEAEEALKPEQHRLFVLTLIGILSVDPALDGNDLTDHFKFMHATAPQRAEAFVKTMEAT